MLDHNKNLYLISFSIFITVHWMMYEYYRDKFHVNQLWELGVKSRRWKLIFEEKMRKSCSRLPFQLKREG